MASIFFAVTWKKVEGAGRGLDLLRRDLDVLDGRADGAVAHENLDRAHVDAGFEEMGGKAVAEGVDPAALGDARQ